MIQSKLNREEPGDDDKNNRYVRAAKFFKQWRKEGVLALDADPALYVYHQQFTYAGLSKTGRWESLLIQNSTASRGSENPQAVASPA